MTGEQKEAALENNRRDEWVVLPPYFNFPQHAIAGFGNLILYWAAQALPRAAGSDPLPQTP